jgi:hypothetical protein
MRSATLSVIGVAGSLDGDRGLRVFLARFLICASRFSLFRRSSRRRMPWTVATDTDMRFYFSTGTRRRAPSSGCCREIATIRSAVFGGILEIDFFDVRFEAILL